MTGNRISGRGAQTSTLPAMPIDVRGLIRFIVSGQPIALALKFQGIRASISVTGQP